METIEKDNILVNTIEPNTEDINDIDEIIFSGKLTCCEIIQIIVFSIIFPFLILVISVTPSIKIIRLDKKKKILTKGTKPIIQCCSCCFSTERIFDLNDVKNIKIQVISQNDPIKAFNKLYFIEGYIYSNNDECECLFSNIIYTKEKFDEYVSFFKKHISTIEEPLEFEKDGVPNEIDITTGEQNNIESKPSINESAPLPVTY